MVFILRLLFVYFFLLTFLFYFVTFAFLAISNSGYFASEPVINQFSYQRELQVTCLRIINSEQ